MNRRRPIFMMVATLAAWMSLTACRCGDALGGLLGAPGPTITPAPTLTMPTVGAPTVALDPESGLTLPAGPDQPFVIEMSETDLNGYLADMSLSREGLAVSEPRVTLNQGEISATFYLDHAESGVGGQITVYGRPQVVQGQVYIQVTSYVLGPQFTGFTRLVAQALIKDALQQYQTGDGIPVPLEEMVVERVEVLPGKMTVWGRTR